MNHRANTECAAQLMRPLRYLDTTQTVTPMRNRTIETEWNSSLASTLTLHGRIDISFSSTIATRSAQSPLHLDRPKTARDSSHCPVLMNRYQLGSCKVFSWATDLHGSYNG